MTQQFIGVKLISAYEAKAPKQIGVYPEGSPGYTVDYPDGYSSWSPKEVFEKAYYPIGNHFPAILAKDVVRNYIKDIKFTHDAKKAFTVAVVTLVNGFTFSVSDGCADPERFDPNIGETLLTEKAVMKTWELLGFVLKWAVNGNAYGEGDDCFDVILDKNEVSVYGCCSNAKPEES